MNFIDNLEKLLLKAGAKLSFNVYHYEGIKDEKKKQRCFNLEFQRRIYKPKEKLKLKNGILSLIKKLKDEDYQDPDYELFHLDLVNKDFFNEILKLNPTSEELFNLYKRTVYGTQNKLYFFLKLIKDKNEKIKYFTYGHNYQNNRESKTLREFISNLKSLNLTDDEWVDILTDHINNSIGFENHDEKKEIIEVCIQCIKDNKKCEEFIKKTLKEEIELSNLYITKKVMTLKMTSSNLIRKFSYKEDYYVNKALDIIINLINKYDGHFMYLKTIDYYKKNSDYNIIFNDIIDESKAISTLKEIIEYGFPQLKDLNLGQWYDTRQETITFNEKFKKMILKINLADTLKTNEVSKKINKL